MSMSLTTAATTNNSITGMLDAITLTPMPVKATKNSEAAAWKLFIAHRMVAFAEAFKKSATKDAITSGVMFDHSKQPRDSGVDEDIYVGNNVRVHLKTANGREMLDAKLLGAHLVTKGYLTAEQWTAAVAQCTKTTAAPHTFTASLRT